MKHLYYIIQILIFFLIISYIESAKQKPIPSYENEIKDFKYTKDKKDISIHNENKESRRSTPLEHKIDIESFKSFKWDTYLSRLRNEDILTPLFSSSNFSFGTIGKEYNRSSIKTFFISLVPSGIINLSYTFGKAFQSIFLNMFNSILPRISFYNYETGQVELSAIAKVYPTEIINETLITQENITISNLEAKYLNTYIAYWQGVLSAGIIFSFIGFLLSGCIFVYTIFVFLYNQLANLCRHRYLGSALQSKIYNKNWPKIRRKKLQNRKFARCYTITISCLLFLFLIIWIPLSFISIVSPSSTMDNVQSSEQNFLNTLEDSFQKSFGSWSNTTTLNIEESIIEVKNSILSSIPDENTIANYSACIENFMIQLPNVSNILNYVTNITKSIEKLPSIEIMILRLNNISTMANQSYQILIDTSNVINDTILQLNTLPVLFYSLSNEFEILKQNTSKFETVEKMTDIIKNFSNFEDIFNSYFNSSYISTFETIMTNNAFSNGLYVLGNLIKTLDTTTNLIINASVEEIISTWTNTKYIKDNLHNDLEIKSLLSNLTTIFDEIDIQSFTNQLSLLTTHFSSMENSILEVISFMEDIVNTFEYIYSFNYLKQEIEKITYALNQKDCIQIMLTQLQNTNSTTIKFPSSLLQLLDNYLQIESLILNLNISIIEDSFSQLNNSIYTDYATMKSEFTSFDLETWKSGFPSQENLIDELDQIANAYIDSLNQFNISNIYDNILQFNTSMNNLPDMSADVTKYVDLMESLYDIKELNSDGTNGPVITLETAYLVMFDEQPTMADNTACNAACEERIRDSTISGGVNTGPTKNMIIVGFWLPGCGISVIPHVWCYFRDDSLNRPDTNSVINKLKAINSTISENLDWNYLIEKSNTLNTSISNLIGLESISKELSQIAYYIDNRKPTFNTFISSIEKLQLSIDAINSTEIDTILLMVNNTYKQLENVTALNLILDLRENITTQLDFSSYISIFSNISNGLSQQSNFFNQMKNNTSNALNELHETIDGWDIARILILFIHWIILLIGSILLCTCCVGFCSLKKKWSKCLYFHPCLLLFMSMFLSFISFNSWISVLASFPPSIALKDYCEQYESNSWTAAKVYLSLSEFSSNLFITSSNFNIPSSIDSLGLSTTTPNVDFSISMETIYYHMAENLCNSQSIDNIEYNLQNIASNLTFIIDDIVSELQSSLQFSFLSNFFQSYESDRDSALQIAQEAISNIFESFDCNTIKSKFIQSKKSICEDLQTSLAFSWCIYLVMAVLCTIFALLYIVAYYCLTNTIIHDEYSKLIENKIELENSKIYSNNITNSMEIDQLDELDKEKINENI